MTEVLAWGGRSAWQFFNVRDDKIVRWTELRTLAQARLPEKQRWFEELVVAVDVQNPLLGPDGCTRVYGPQKDCARRDFDFAERCLEQLTTIIQKELHLDYANEPGTGAAGGLGYGLRCFANARLEPGFALFSHYAQLPERLKSAHLVLTGEGAIDQSTLMGKGVGELARPLQKKCSAVYRICRSGTGRGPGPATLCKDARADPGFHFPRKGHGRTRCLADPLGRGGSQKLARLRNRS